jgi:serine/threonine protein phosphatase PrpC
MSGYYTMDTVFQVLSLGSTVCGRGHQHNGLPCQDKYYKNRYRGVEAIALADGAGSALHSETGADIAARRACTYLTYNFKKIWEKSNSDISQIVIPEIRKSILQKSDAKEDNLCDYASTLMAVAILNDKYIAIHVGDGVIATLDADDVTLRVLSEPERGEYANTTVFVVSERAETKLRVYKGKTNHFSGFCLMTDGAMDSLYDKSQRAPAKAVRTMIAWMAQHSYVEVEGAVEDAITSMLLPKTSDDCGVCLMRLYRPTNLVNISTELAMNIFRCRTQSELSKRLTVLKDASDRTVLGDAVYASVEKNAILQQMLLVQAIDTQFFTKNHINELMRMGLIAEDKPLV